MPSPTPGPGEVQLHDHGLAGGDAGRADQASAGAATNPPGDADQGDQRQQDEERARQHELALLLGHPEGEQPAPQGRQAGPAKGESGGGHRQRLSGTGTPATAAAITSATERRLN